MATNAHAKAMAARIQTLAAENAALAERVKALEKQHRADNRLIEQALSVDDRRKVRQLWDKYDAENVAAANARDKAEARVAALESALREIVGNPHVTDKSWEAVIAAAALEGKK